ncbi:N-acetylglucosamine-1-phosphodiester alpha-N-acetylglucosaminidase-like [Symphorus nematophorus]
MVRDSGGQRDAQFGIRKDGSLVFGYLSQEDVLDRSNPFVQLVSGVVWLLWQVADFLKKNGVIDAINLDGGGCVHRRRCEPADRGGHGDCVDGRRRCQQGWRGAACDSLVCRPPACGPHGVCSANTPPRA